MVRRILVVLALVALSACRQDAPAPRPQPSASAGPSATEACGEVETFPVQGEGHLVGNQKPPIPYNSTPPTSGWHSSTDVPIIVTPESDPLSEPEQVTVLERGGVVVSHGKLPDADRTELEQLVSDKFAGQAALTSYDKLADGEVALTSWGVLQRCDELDTAAVEAFVSFYAQR